MTGKKRVPPKDSFAIQISRWNGQSTYLFFFLSHRFDHALTIRCPLSFVHRKQKYRNTLVVNIYKLQMLSHFSFNGHFVACCTLLVSADKVFPVSTSDIACNIYLHSLLL